MLNNLFKRLSPGQVRLSDFSNQNWFEKGDVPSKDLLSLKQHHDAFQKKDQHDFVSIVKQTFCSILFGVQYLKLKSIDNISALL